MLWPYVVKTRSFHLPACCGFHRKKTWVCGVEGAFLLSYEISGDRPQYTPGLQPMCPERLVGKMTLVVIDHLRQVSKLYLFAVFYRIFPWPEVSHVMLSDARFCLQPFTCLFHYPCAFEGWWTDSERSDCIRVEPQSSYISGLLVTLQKCLEGAGKCRWMK